MHAADAAHHGSSQATEPLCAGSRQVLPRHGGGGGGTARRGGAGPLQAVRGRLAGQVEGFVLDRGVGIPAVDDGDEAVGGVHALDVVAGDGLRLRQAGGLVAAGKRAVLGIKIPHRHLGAGGQAQPFRDLGADGVVLVGGDGDGGQDANDGDHDHQLDQGETLVQKAGGWTLDVAHGGFPVVVGSVGGLPVALRGHAGLSAPARLDEAKPPQQLGLSIRAEGVTDFTETPSKSTH